MPQDLSSRTAKYVPLRIVDKLLRIKLFSYALPASQSLSLLSQGTNKVHSLVGHQRYVFTRCKSAIHHYLRGLASQVLLHSQHCTVEFSKITAALSHRCTHNNPVRSLRGYLHVVTRSKAPVTLLHDPRLRIGLAGSRSLFICFLGLTNFLQFRKRLFQSFLTLTQCALSCCPFALRFFLPRIAHGF